MMSTRASYLVEVRIPAIAVCASEAESSPESTSCRDFGKAAWKNNIIPQPFGAGMVKNPFL